MITFPIAKINLGLNVVERRADGYHNLETVFYPVPLCDALEVTPMDEAFPSDMDCDLKVTGIDVEGDERQNLVVKAYQLLKSDFPQLMRVHAHLCKRIPTQAGMGGGSSDGAAMLRMMNDMGRLRLSERQLAGYAARLGADCPFFISGTPAYAEGIGEQLHETDVSLAGLWMLVVRPDIPVPTREAFMHVSPRRPPHCCRDVVMQPIETWRTMLTNDFENSVFALHPEIGRIKQQLYGLGALYAAMSGSGSALFGLFDRQVDTAGMFEGMYVRQLKMK